MNDGYRPGRMAGVNGVSCLPRRRVLALPAVAAGLFAPGAAQAVAAVSRLGDGSAGRISLGYWPASSQIDRFDALSHAYGDILVDELNVPLEPGMCAEPVCSDLADRGPADFAAAAFSRPQVSVRIHGLYQAGGGRIEPMAMHLHPGGGTLPACTVWSVAGEAPDCASSPTCFVADVSSGRLSLSFDIGARRDEGLTPTDESYYRRHIFVRLARDPGPGMPALRRGVYALAWTAGSRTFLPDWSHYAMELALPVATVETADTSQPDAEANRDLTAGLSSDFQPSDDVEAEAGDMRVFSRLAPRGALRGPTSFSYLLFSLDNA